MIDTLRLGIDIKIPDNLYSKWPKTKFEGFSEYGNNYLDQHADFNLKFGSATVAFNYHRNDIFHKDRSILLISFSVPKILFGNNVEMVTDCNSQLSNVLNSLQMFIDQNTRSMIPPINIYDSLVHRLDVCWNHKVGDLSPYYLRSARNKDCAKKERKPYNGGVVWGNETGFSIMIYDKFLECNQPEAYGILRQERSMRNRRVIRDVFGNDITPAEITQSKVLSFLLSDLQLLGFDCITSGSRSQAISSLIKKFGTSTSLMCLGYMILKSDGIMKREIANLLNLKDNRKLNEYERHIRSIGLSSDFGDGVPDLRPLGHDIIDLLKLCSNKTSPQGEIRSKKVDNIDRIISDTSVIIGTAPLENGSKNDKKTGTRRGDNLQKKRRSMDSSDDPQRKKDQQLLQDTTGSTGVAAPDKDTDPKWVDNCRSTDTLERVSGAVASVDRFDSETKDAGTIRTGEPPIHSSSVRKSKAKRPATGTNSSTVQCEIKQRNKPQDHLNDPCGSSQGNEPGDEVGNDRAKPGQRRKPTKNSAQGNENPGRCASEEYASGSEGHPSGDPAARGSDHRAKRRRTDRSEMGRPGLAESQLENSKTNSTSEGQGVNRDRAKISGGEKNSEARINCDRETARAPENPAKNEIVCRGEMGRDGSDLS